MIARNPLIKRYSYSLMRPRQFWIYMTIYIAVLLMIFFINYSGYKNEVMYKTFTELFRSLYYQFLVMQILVLWVWGSFNSGSAIREEVFDKTYDFFRLLPIAPGTKAAGILIGKNLIVLLLAGCSLVLMVVFAFMCGLHLMLLLQVILVIVSVALLANTAALLLSINTRGKKRKNEIIGFILLAFFLGPAIINGIIAFAAAKDIETIMGRFFEFKVPVLILASLVALYFCCWAVKGLLRKFTYEEEPMFNRAGALLFMLGYEFVLFGLFYHYLIRENNALFIRGLNIGYWLASLPPIILIPLASIRSIDRYMEFAGLIVGRPDKKRNVLRLLLHSNLSLWLCLFVIWAVFAAATTYHAKLPLVDNLVIIGVIFSFYLFTLLLLEVYVVASPYSSKIGVLLAFILAVFIILPLILSAVLMVKGFLPHSPFGYFIHMLDITRREFTTDARVAAVNLLLCVAPAVLIYTQYKNIIESRRNMQGV